MIETVLPGLGDKSSEKQHINAHSLLGKYIHSLRSLRAPITPFSSLEVLEMRPSDVMCRIVLLSAVE